MSDEEPVGYAVNRCRIFVSDLHVGAGLGLDPEPGKFAWEWCTRSDMARFLAFLRMIEKRDDVDEMVLIGDIFDSWVFPHDIRPPTLLELIDSNHAKPVVDALCQLAKKISVVYLPGNHDIMVDGETVEMALPGVKYGGSGLQESFFASGRLRAEHGHAHALFCSADPNVDEGLPLGYFVSRIAATADRDTGGHGITRQQIVRDIIDTIKEEDLGHGVIDAICRRAGLTDSDKILMPTDLWGGSTVTVKNVNQLYEHLLARWEKKHGAVAAMLAIPAELDELEACTLPMFAQGGINAVIMGHTHQPLAHEHNIPFLGRAAYANAGCWCKDVSRATWVEQMKLEGDKGKHTVLTVMGCSGVDDEGNLTGVVAEMIPAIAG